MDVSTKIGMSLEDLAKKEKGRPPHKKIRSIVISSK